ncbi:MAG: 16S rRNA (guanine(966)-N(2))-methyltransferase RsmD [Gemmatimonadota bacterium]
MRIIAGRWRGHTIASPPGDRTRPTTDRVREAWMSMMQTAIPGARVLDLFAGSGGLGLETLSRGARHVTFVERSGAVLKTLRANVRKLGAEGETSIVRADAVDFVRAVERGTYDLVVADPPYGSGHAEALAGLFLRQPFAEMLWIEHRVTDPLPEGPDSEGRRYGDTMITRYLAPE